MLAKRLGYVTLQVENLPAAVAFYERFIQLHVTETHDDAVFLSGGPEHHWVVLRSDPGVPLGMRRIAFELSDDVSVDKAQSLLEDFGVDVRRSSALGQDRVGESLRFLDPNGFELELFTAMVGNPGPGVPKFVAIEQMLHTAFSVRDLRESLRFYCDVLGFGVSDWVEDTSVFLHAANRKHHSLVLQGRPGEPKADHICFQTATFDDLMRARALAKSADLDLRDDLLRHAPSNSVGFYIAGTMPPGIALEFCHGHETLTPDHVPTVYPRTIQAKDVWQPPANY